MKTLLCHYFHLHGLPKKKYTLTDSYDPSYDNENINKDIINRSKLLNNINSNFY